MLSLLTALVIGQYCPNGQCPQRVVYSRPTYAAQTTFQGLEPVAAINAARARRGLPAFVSDAGLNAEAARRAGMCAASRTISHAGWRGDVGECLAYGYGHLGTAEGTVKNSLASALRAI